MERHPDARQRAGLGGQRSALWNAVERSEKRKDAQLFREAELSIPRELSPAQRLALVRAFVKDEFVSRGMVADIGLHCPRASDGGEQPHAHVMLTMRTIGPGGFGKKERAWNDREMVKQARESWERWCNAALAEAGSSARVDHRSLAAQGKAHDRQPHQGRAVHVRERTGAYVTKREELVRTHFANRARETVRAIGRDQVRAPGRKEDADRQVSAASPFDEQARQMRRAVAGLSRRGTYRKARDGVAHAAETARWLQGEAPELKPRIARRSCGAMTDRFQQHVAAQGRAPQLVKDSEPEDDPAKPDGYIAVRRIRSFQFADVVFRRHGGAPQAFPWVYLRSWLADGEGTRLTLVWPEMVVSLTGRHLDTIEEDIMRRIVAEFRQAGPGQADQVAPACRRSLPWTSRRPTFKVEAE